MSRMRVMWGQLKGVFSKSPPTGGGVTAVADQDVPSPGPEAEKQNTDKNVQEGTQKFGSTGGQFKKLKGSDDLNPRQKQIFDDKLKQAIAKDPRAKTGAMSEAELIDRLSESLPLDPDKVSAILSVPLEHDSQGDTPVMTSYKQPAEVSDSRFKAVELRIPDPVFGKGAGLLSATLKNDEGLDSNAVLGHYGLEFQQDVPSPRYPPDTPAYYTYEQPWGQLSLGVTNDKSGRLVSFVMEPKELP